MFLSRVGWLALVFVLAATARAQIPYTGGSYAQSFDTLPPAGSVTLAGPGPHALDAAPISAAGLTGWSLIKYAGTGANAVFSIGTGTNTAGAVYSFGLAGNPDRALGSVASGGVGSRFGVAFVNNTGGTLTAFSVGFTGEQWRRGSAAANTLAFAYAVGATDLNTGTFVDTSTLDLTAPATTGTTNTAAALDGTLPANRKAVTATVNGISWAPGQTLVLRWSDVDNSGSDDGLAIDDFTFSTDSPPDDRPPSIVATTPAAGATNIAPDAPLSVTFNVPVTVTGSWFTLTGSVSGPHPATVTGGPTAFTLTPATPFADGETVTATFFAAQIADAATGTQAPVADSTLTFTVLSTTPVPIHTVQGATGASAYAGQTVTVEGVVTASYQGTGGLGGFYVQAPESAYDADPATSEGLFVFTTTFPASVGELVKVTGTVAEFGSGGSTQTELTSVTSVTKTGTTALPAPVVVTLPFATLTEAERYEGMRVTLPQTLTVTDTFDLGRFGEVILSNGRLPTPTNIVAPGAPAQAQDVANFLNQLLLDDGVGSTYPNPTPYLADSAGLGLTRRAGSTATGVTGILDEKFGAYVLEPTEAVTFTDANPRGAPPAVGGTLRVAIGNVLNYFNGDGAGGGYPTSRGADTPAEFQRQRVKIIAGIVALAPDIMGLTEVENDGFGPTSSIADLVAGLNAAAPAGTTYAFVDTSTVDQTSDAIRNAFLYRTETVELVGAPAALNGIYFVGLARSPLAQTFREKASGEKLTISINHFKSKGSASTGPAATDGLTPNPNLDQGDGQGQSNYLRKRQAETLVQWLATDPTGSGDPDFLIIGDLNAYAKEDPIVAIEQAGYINLTETFEGVGGYSYSFGGSFGHLDHALASDPLTDQVVGAATWHVNSDEPVYYDYNTENKTAGQQAINSGNAYRYSDHDPVVIGLALRPAGSAPTITTPPASQIVDAGATVTFTVAAAGTPPPTYQWFKDNVILPGATAASLTLTAVKPADAGAYTVVVTNALGSATSAPATLTVRDVKAPVISSLTATPAVLRPVNYRFVPVTVTAVVTDDTDPAPVTRILAVKSNQPNLGPLSGPADWVITGPLTVNLRAERTLLLFTRVYTLTIESRDVSGNASTKTVTVTVPGLF